MQFSDDEENQEQEMIDGGSHPSAPFIKLLEGKLEKLQQTTVHTSS